MGEVGGEAAVAVKMWRVSMSQVQGGLCLRAFTRLLMLSRAVERYSLDDRISERKA